MAHASPVQSFRSSPNRMEFATFIQLLIIQPRMAKRNVQWRLLQRVWRKPLKTHQRCKFQDFFFGTAWLHTHTTGVAPAVQISNSGERWEKNFEVGTDVLAKNFGAGKCWLTEMIFHSCGPKSYKIELNEGCIVRQHPSSNSWFPIWHWSGLRWLDRFTACWNCTTSRAAHSIRGPNSTSGTFCTHDCYDVQLAMFIHGHEQAA